MATTSPPATSTTSPDFGATSERLEADQTAIEPDLPGRSREARTVSSTIGSEAVATSLGPMRQGTRRRAFHSSAEGGRVRHTRCPDFDGAADEAPSVDEQRGVAPAASPSVRTAPGSVLAVVIASESRGSLGNGSCGSVARISDLHGCCVVVRSRSLRGAARNRSSSVALNPIVCRVSAGAGRNVTSYAECSNRRFAGGSARCRVVHGGI